MAISIAETCNCWYLYSICCGDILFVGFIGCKHKRNESP